MINDLFQKFMQWVHTELDMWLIIGLLGQTLFMMRFIVQWIASERAKKSVMPDIFWYFSLGGGLIVLIYGLHKLEPVIILGQLPGVFVYSRNIYLIWRHKRISDVR